MRKYVLNIGDREFKAEVKEITSDYADILIGDVEYHVELKQLGQKSGPGPGIRRITPAGTASSAPTQTPSVPKTEGPSGGVQAPLPGLILEIMVKEGDSVKAGQDLLAMEAMKMENKIQAPHDGTVKKLFVQNGNNVAEGDQLLEITRPLMTTV